MILLCVSGFMRSLMRFMQVEVQVNINGYGRKLVVYRLKRWRSSLELVYLFEKALESYDKWNKLVHRAKTNGTKKSGDTWVLKFKITLE